MRGQISITEDLDEPLDALMAEYALIEARANAATASLGLMADLLMWTQQCGSSTIWNLTRHLLGNSR